MYSDDCRAGVTSVGSANGAVLVEADWSEAEVYSLAVRDLAVFLTDGSLRNCSKAFLEATDRLIDELSWRRGIKSSLTAYQRMLRFRLVEIRMASTVDDERSSHGYKERTKRDV